MYKKPVWDNTWREGSQLKAKVQIFLSYARDDKEAVEKLYQKLLEAGFKPWIDTKDILPGERWKSSIQKAIRCSDFFLACLSAKSINKRGFLQKEIKIALDICREMLDSDIYLIPVRLEDCEVPESLRDFQWVDIFEENGWVQLVRAIQVGMKRRAALEKPHLDIVTTEQSLERANLQKYWKEIERCTRLRQWPRVIRLVYGAKLTRWAHCPLGLTEP
ncbi:MAG TPA: toll/interleukin-1 receptor domain-containing protein [Methanophagales archaeon]|nr:toll/interleukin-1 receptor domain-containing protein [Methanophagales archaeon]